MGDYQKRDRRTSAGESALQLRCPGSGTGEANMFDGVTYVHPNYDPIIHEGESAATVIVMNAGPLHSRTTRVAPPACGRRS
jgi:hypothetical protein